MYYMNNVLETIEKNKGKVIKFGESDEFALESYLSSSLQANIAVTGKAPFLKIEQRQEETVTISLEGKEEGVIDYGAHVTLDESAPVIDLFTKYEQSDSELPKCIGLALIALLSM